MRKLRKPLIAAMVIIIALFPCSMTAGAVSTNTIVSKLISVASNEIGYSGSRSYSKYGEWYGYQGGWCTTFALWCFNKTGEELGVKLYSTVTPSGGNCNSMKSWYSNKGWYKPRSSGYTPKAGDIAFFDWSGNGSSQHVGIVKGVSGSTIYTIEGNCSGKVKAKSYTPNGSKPYASTSSIMGYGVPNWSIVGSGTVTTTKKSATTKATIKATTKPTTTKQNKTETTTKPAETTTTTTTTKPTTTVAAKAKDMHIRAATNSLEVGESVKLDYEITPANSSAVVGYFCDEENIIEISDTGVITATGEGKATVVVCANDEIYRQCDFTVTKASAAVTTQTPNEIKTIPYKGANVKKTPEQKLNAAGVNTQRLKEHKNYFAVPLTILAFTAAISLVILGFKKLANIIRSKKEETND